MSLRIKSDEIRSLELLNPLPIWSKVYVLPFLVLYPLATYAYTAKYQEWLNEEQANTFLVCLALFGSHALSFLGTKWSASYRARMTCVKATSMKTASLIRIIPQKDKGAGDIVPLQKSRRTATSPESVYWFSYQRDKFTYSPENKEFSRLAYPVDTIPAPTLSTFQNSEGLSTTGAVNAAENAYGKNTFDIPIPTFKELFGEHAVAPFFVFQLFCVGLWCLDEYWYYSIFTLFMLVVFECTVVFQRQRTLAEFRTMTIKPYPINVYRAGSWFEVLSDALLPGDLVSIVRSKEDSGLPCDLILLQGSCIVNEAMLSGESTPLLKESIALRPPTDVLDMNGADRNSILFGGTKVLQASATSESDKEDKQTPDGGCIAIVLKTGFGTSQGQLVRTMIFSTERVTANNLESFLFIGFLLIFAIAASAYVWIKGVENDRPRMKLLLDCVIIITSVVPPELPMELSLAVNNSLVALSKYAIFCTEPFRIPLAGSVDVCCFDKTGTITGEDLIVEGIAGVDPSNPRKLTPVHETTMETTLTLASAHALVLLDEAGVVGDPMEKTTLDALGWSLSSGDTIGPAPPAKEKKRLELAAPVKKGVVKPAEPLPPVPKPQSPHKAVVQIKRRYQFSSALKRMSTVSSIQTPSEPKRKLLVSVKGAPETLKNMYNSVPADYEMTYKWYAQQGSRVLALGYKWLEGVSPDQVNRLDRERVECDLHFAGFLVFHCPLKPDAVKSIKALNDSSHRCIMITGDNPLTATHVARDVEIVDRDVLILDLKDGATSETDLIWKSVDETKTMPVDVNKPIDQEILNNYDICMTGAALKQFASRPAWSEQLVRHVWVYARVSPTQKEFIIATLKELGYITLMAGDGTNDVGALKRAHIGVALLNGSMEDLKQIAEHQKLERIKKIYEQQMKLTRRFNQAPPPVPLAIQHLYPEMVEAQKKAAAEHAAGMKQAQPQKFDMDQIMSKMSALEEDDQPPTIKLGDASVAAPFTSKLSNVAAIVNIIRQGRCTLVATMQMYKILGLNCLISAYSLSVQYLDGIKYGDYQVTITGLLMSVCFFCISRAKPVDKLSKERPLGNIFSFYVLFSVLLQFAIHIVSFLYVTGLSEYYEPRSEKVDLEKEFKPSLLNSAVYLVSLTQQVSTFALNYQGRPFREGLTENPALYYGLLGVAGVAINGALDLVPEFNKWLQLTDMPWNFRYRLIIAMCFDYGGAYAGEQFMKWAFIDKKPKELITRGSDRREKRRKVEEEAEKLALEDKKAQ